MSNTARYKNTNNTSKKKNLILNIIIVILALISIVSAFIVLNYFIGSSNDKKTFNKLADFVDKNSDSLDIDKEYNDTEKPPSQEEIDASILKAYNDLKASNPDMVGWLKIDDTLINYPVMHTPKDIEYYLRRNFEKKSSQAGVPFVGENCSVSPNNDHILLYGHNMDDGSMFADTFKYYNDNQFVEDHKYIQFDTMQERAVYEVFSVYKIDVASNNGHYDFYNKTNLSNEDDFNSFVNTMKSLSVYKSDINPVFGDEFISLVTCSYHNTNGRLVIVARKVQE